MDLIHFCDTVLLAPFIGGDAACNAVDELRSI